jgi:hypothetical protein
MNNSAVLTYDFQVKLAEELGADLIKTNYSGDVTSFKRITEACSVPVLIAGGEKGGDLETLIRSGMQLQLALQVSVWVVTRSNATIPVGTSIPSAMSSTMESSLKRPW